MVPIEDVLLTITTNHMPNPILAGQTHLYEFRPDGSYALSILVSEGYEMLSRSGLVTEENHVLVVEDEETYRDSLKFIFEREGFTVSYNFV